MHITFWYSGTQLIWSPMGPKNLAVLTGWPYYRGRLKFHDLRAVITNTLYSAFAFLEQLFSLINNQNVRCKIYCVDWFLFMTYLVKTEWHTCISASCRLYVANTALVHPRYYWCKVLFVCVFKKKMHPV